jgi:hypothetical protein
MSTARYAYAHVSSEILSEDMQFGGSAPKPGDPLPEFGLPTVEGGSLRTGTLTGRRPVLPQPRVHIKQFKFLRHDTPRR